MKNLILPFKTNSKFQYCIYIFVLAFVFRVFIIKFYNTDAITPDGTGYYRLAQNLSEGKGYIGFNGEKCFFREPGYPLFLSPAFHISKLFGHDSGILVYDENCKIINKSTEFVVAKYMQAILDSFACILFFLLIFHIIKRKYAFLIAVAFCFYYPYAVHVTYILRETLQSLLALAMCYGLLQYFKFNSTKYLILTGIIWGLLNLTFQANVIFAVSIPIFIWISKKRLIKAIIPSVIAGMVMLLTASPWLIRTYHYYPDIRILKSFGTSFTTEYRGYYSSLVKAEYYGLINKEQMDSTYFADLAGLTDDELFKHSYDGTISKRTDSINALINEPLISKRKIIMVATYLRNCAPQTSAKPYIKEKPVLAALLILPIALLCLFSILGVLRFFPKFFKINIVFITYLLMFIVIASEKRRMLPIQPFILLYGLMGFFYLYYKYFKRLDNNSINELFFLTGNA